MQRALVLTLLLVGCRARPPAHRSFAITHGQPDPGDDAVVALVTQPTLCGQPVQPFCTGSLIAPRAVLTARHCATAAPLAIAQVVFGADATGGTGVGVAQAFSHPDPAVDLAVLALAQPSTVMPLALAATPPAGTQVRLVGFGADELGALGTKRQGTALAGAPTALTFPITPDPSLSCGGDSGGPVLTASGIAGVTSSGDGTCMLTGDNVRTDAQAAFIASVLQQIDALPVAAPRAPFDPHADLCASVCATDGDCPDGTACVQGRCGVGAMPAGRLGAACSGDSACGSDPCVQTPSGCRCYARCNPGGGCSFSRF